MVHTLRSVSNSIKDILVVDVPSQRNYLGSKLKPRCGHKGDQEVIFGKIESRLDGWKGSTLAQAGGRILILSVSSMIPNYWLGFQSFKKMFMNCLHQAQARFLQFKQHASKVWILISWNKLSRPIQEGGLGIRSIMDMKNVVMVQTVWRFLTSLDALWARVLTQKYLRNQSFQEVGIKNGDSNFLEGYGKIQIYHHQ